MHYGNIIGTNIVNICGILATVSLIKTVSFKKDTVRKDMYMSVVASLVLITLMADKWFNQETVNAISRTDGLVLLILFGIFIYYTFYPFIEYWRDRKENKKEIRIKLKDIDVLTKNILLMLLGIAMVFIGANWVVDSVEKIALFFGVSETLISVLVVAIGTSLPEIFTSIAAIKKDKQDMAIGNIIGSNLINILLILGLTAVINPIYLEMDSLIIDAVILLSITVLLLINMHCNEKYEMSKFEGLALISIYVMYFIYVFLRG